MADRIVCPVHGIPDCSPLLNGCNRVNIAHCAREGHRTVYARQVLPDSAQTYRCQCGAVVSRKRDPDHG